MSNNYEQPVEPMSRVEDILRGDTTNVPQSRVEDLLKQLIEQGGGGGGSTVIVTQILSEGTKIASISVNGSIIDLYAPTDTGSTVSISTIQQTGTKIATLTIDDTDYDIYAPEGGGGGGNLYGTTDPTSDQGSNGDIYMKYQGGSEPVEGETETLTNVYLAITRGTDWVALPNFDASLYYSVIFNHGVNPQLSTKINISDISTDANNPTIFGNTYDDLYGYINNSTLYLKTVTWNSVINSAIVTLNVFQPPQILNVFGKVEDEWVGFPEEGYKETTLWEGSQSITQYSVPFTIPDIGMAELNKYDAFAFEFYNSYSISRFGIMLTSFIKNHKDTDVTLAPDPTDSANPLLIHYDSTNDVLKAFGTTAHGYTLTKVTGIKYGNGGGSSSSSLNYSTDEQVVGTWIDGKPIYQRTLQVDQSIHTYTGGWSEKDLGIVASDYDINMIIKCFLWCVDNTDASTKGCVQPEWTRILNGTIRVSMPQGWNANAKSITLQYTKTTD